MDDKAYDTPADVDADEGEVVVIGPGGIRYNFTPEAAEETSDRMLFGAAKAKGQQILGKDKRKPDA